MKILLAIAITLMLASCTPAPTTCDDTTLIDSVIKISDENKEMYGGAKILTITHPRMIRAYDTTLECRGEAIWNTTRRSNIKYKMYEAGGRKLVEFQWGN